MKMRSKGPEVERNRMVCSVSPCRVLGNFLERGSGGDHQTRKHRARDIECIYSVIPVAKVADAAGAERELMEDNQRRD